MAITGKIKLFTIILLTVFQVSEPLKGQSAMPEILENGTLQEQLDYIQDRTLIYNNFRAIREDMFLKIKNNSLDSLVSTKNLVSGLTADLNSRSREMDSLSALLENTRNELNLAVENRDRISFLGIPMNKTGYNFMVWIIIAGLAALLGIGFMLFSRNRLITVSALRELEGLKQEFETYRISSREKREKLVMEHFNEIKRMKES